MANLNETQPNNPSEIESELNNRPGGGVSGWTRLRGKLQLSQKNSSVLLTLKESLKSTYQSTEKEIRRIGEREFGEFSGPISREAISTRVKSLNDAVIGMSMDSDSQCTCTHGSSCINPDGVTLTSEEGSEPGSQCQCSCSKCYHKRPENDHKPEPEAQEHFTHIKHASLYMC